MSIVSLARASVEVPAGGVTLEGDLARPRGASGLVIFAHGSGSGRLSPRNRFVAERLNEAGLATLLLDLLTETEEGFDEPTGEYRFDIALLAGRVEAAAEFARARAELSGLRLGLFGASTGAAAALVAAAEKPDWISAVVSRGGRPDLAGPYLGGVRAPTLLIVGGADHPDVLRWNQEASRKLRGPRELLTIPGASHLFEEPGALERVADAAAAWFERFAGPRTRP